MRRPGISSPFGVRVAVLVAAGSLIAACDTPEGTASPEGVSPAAVTPPPSTEQPGAVEPVAEAPAAATPGQPPVKRPNDRDQEEEKRKMSLSRERSGKAMTQLRQGNLERAVREARQALKIHEQNVQAMLIIAEAFYKQGKYEIAQSVASSVLEVDPRVLTAEESSMAYNLRGFAFLAESKDEPAMNMFRKAAEGDPNNAAAWNNLGVAYMRQGDYATALSCFDYATQLRPEFIKAKLNLGAAQRAQGKLVEAEQTFQSVLKSRPRYAEVHFNLGVLYLDGESFPNLDTKARLNKAIQSFTKYKELTIGGGTQRPGEAPPSKPKQSSGSGDATDAGIDGEFVSPAQADLYIGVAKKGLEREERRLERERKRDQKDTTPAQSPGDDGDGDDTSDGAPAKPDETAKPAQPSAPAKPSAPDDGGQKPGARDPDAEPPGAQKPGAQKPGAQKPGAQKPGAQKPGTQQPSPQKPSPQKPGGG